MLATKKSSQFNPPVGSLSFAYVSGNQMPVRILGGNEWFVMKRKESEEAVGSLLGQSIIICRRKVWGQKDFIVLF